MEVEQLPEETAVPDQRIERGKERDGGRRFRRRFQQLDVLAEDEALAADALDLHGNELAVLDQLRAQRGSSRMVRRWLRGAEAAEDVSTAPDAEQPVGAVAGQELVPELFLQRQIAREQVGRQQPLEEVVVPAVPVTPSEAEHAGDGVCIEHGAHGVRRYPEPVGLRPALALEIERRQRSLRADLLEHPLGHLGVLGECPRRLLVDGRAEPGELAGGTKERPLLYASKISRRSYSSSHQAGS